MTFASLLLVLLSFFASANVLGGQERCDRSLMDRPALLEAINEVARAHREDGDQKLELRKKVVTQLSALIYRVLRKNRIYRFSHIEEQEAFNELYIHLVAQLHHFRNDTSLGSILRFMEQNLTRALWYFIEEGQQHVHLPKDTNTRLFFTSLPTVSKSKDTHQALKELAERCKCSVESMEMLWFWHQGKVVRQQEFIRGEDSDQQSLDMASQSRWSFPQGEQLRSVEEFELQLWRTLETNPQMDRLDHYVLLTAFRFLFAGDHKLVEWLEERHFPGPSNLAKKAKLWLRDYGKIFFAEGDLTTTAMATQALLGPKLRSQVAANQVESRLDFRLPEMSESALVDDVLVGTVTRTSQTAVTEPVTKTTQSNAEGVQPASGQRFRPERDSLELLRDDQILIQRFESLLSNAKALDAEDLVVALILADVLAQAPGAEWKTLQRTTKQFRSLWLARFMNEFGVKFQSLSAPITANNKWKRRQQHFASYQAINGAGLMENALIAWYFSTYGERIK